MTPRLTATIARCAALLAHPVARERCHRARRQARVDTAAAIDVRGTERRPLIVADCDEDARERATAHGWRW